jgi:hypothetical protein
MKKYQMAMIGRNEYDSIYFECSDQKTIQWFLDEVSKLFPKSKSVNKDDENSNYFTIDKNRYSCQPEKIGGKGSQLNNWLHCELLSKGWEPYAVHAGSDYFRREIIE